MGVVYLARDERLGRQVALKVLSEYELPDAERRAMFMREARSAAAITHPNVATIHEVGETKDGLPFIVMEYCEGKTATTLAREEALETARFLNIARQIAEGLAAAHRQGVIHRDIKGANIIVEPGDHVKILDFGLAKVLRTNTNSSSSSAGFFGTVPYLSPEQARGGVADARSDLFSAGVALYELASGKLPFNAEGPLALLEKIRDAEPEPFSPRDPAFPESLARMIGKLLQKEPADRYQTAGELLDDLHTAATEIEAHPTRPATTRRTAALGRTVRRRTIRYVLAAAGLIAITVGIVITAEVMSRSDGHLAGQPLTPIRSIAVLPFQNLSEQQRDNFLSVGLADALVTRLQQIPTLQVRPTAAVLKFRGKEIDAQTAAEQLGVDGILHGRYITSGGQVRVNLQLTDSRTGYGVWAGTIDGSRDNLITLMDDVSSRTANALQPAEPGNTTQQRSEPRTSNPKAFEHFLRARAFSGSLVPQQHAEQIAALRKAIELDPRFAAAHAELAIALTLGQIRGMEQESVTAEAERYARQAVNLDPYLPEAHLALGRTLVRFPDRFRESARENLSALRLNPNDPQALYTMASYLVASGDLGRKNCILDRMVRLDPSSNDARTRGYFDVNSIDPEKTIESARFALVAPETELAGHDMLALAHLAQDDFDAATREYQRAAELVPNHYIPKSLAAMIAAGKGDRKEAERWIAQFSNEAERNHWAALRIVQAYAKLGDRQKALKWAHTTQQLGNHSWYFLVRHPWLQSLQNDPEYQQMLKEIRADLDAVHGDVIGVYDVICGSRADS
jgi:eukaryotic-like serine/threonine-protein kinase